MRLPKGHTEEPRRHIQNVKIYIFIIRKQTKVSSREGARAIQKASTKAPRRPIQNVKIYTFLIRKLIKVSSGKDAFGSAMHTGKGA